ncbi:MAG: hypothetical protein KatS3mg076_1115 [Candidatus Binatia bacterium]|nr:MAG: hypothetical protein KatS3mg076_1115 [Candidatus Binatia bacterium]
MKRLLGTGVLSATFLSLLSWAGAQQTQDALQGQRSFGRFELDTGTVDGLWVEAGVAHFQERTRIRKLTVRDTVTFTTPFARVAAGDGRLWEAGLLVPVVIREFDRDVDPAFEDNPDVLALPLPFDDETGIGDIQAYGKAVPVRTDFFDLGAGLLLSFPSGDEDEGLGSGQVGFLPSVGLLPSTVGAGTSKKGIGTGEVGFLPYATAALKFRTLELRAHGGYEWFTDETSTAIEAAVYGGGLYYLYHPRFSLRADFVGLSADVLGPDDDFVTFEPGFDLQMRIGPLDCVVRSFGAIGMTEVSPDWGVGGSVAVQMRSEAIGL